MTLNNVSSEDEQWKYTAQCDQLQKAGMFNKIDVCRIEVLRNRLAICLFGIPETIRNNPAKMGNNDTLSYTQYNKQQQNIVINLAQCILQHQKYPDEYKIHVSFVLVFGRAISGNENQKNFLEWVFKIPGRGISTFIDKNCRVYRNWEDYLTNNTLPKATICYPDNGNYPEDECNVRVNFANTPACSVAKKVLLGFDIATAITSVVGAAAVTTSLIVPIAAPLVWTAFAVSAASGAYSAGRSIEYIVDRGTHKETLSFLNSQARSAWLGATVPLFGIVAGSAAAVAATARVTNIGVTITQAGRTAINVTNGVNCVAHGVCLGNDVYNIIETAINGNKVSAIQIAQCVASFLLFANTVVTAYQARMILQSSREMGGIENLYAILSQSYKENGSIIRPTNLLTSSNITSLISVAIPWSGMYLNVPPTVGKSIENIIHFLMKNRNGSIISIATGLIPHLRTLWEKLESHTKKHSYQKMQVLPAPCSSQENICFHSKTETKNEDKITIAEMDSEEEKETFQEIIHDILENEDISELDLLQMSQFMFQTLKKELAEKENQFQTMLKENPNLTEKQLENILLIKGKRSQHFANEIMKSYKDLKVISLKQDCQRLIEKNGIQLPLHSRDSPVKILYYHSFQKEGTKTKKYLKILQKVGVFTENNAHTYFPSENSFFVDLRSGNSKYNMAGVMNFSMDRDMMGIIILQ